MNFIKLSLIALGICLFPSCKNSKTPEVAVKEEVAATHQDQVRKKYALDVHTYAQPNKAVATHLNLDIHVDFDTEIIKGIASYDIRTSKKADTIVFDSKYLIIDSAIRALLDPEFCNSQYALLGVCSVLMLPSKAVLMLP